MEKDQTPRPPLGFGKIYMSHQKFLSISTNLRQGAWYGESLAICAKIYSPRNHIILTGCKKVYGPKICIT